MVQEWHSSTGFPAVLAVWAAREGVVTPDVLRDFSASRDFGIARIAEISEAATRELQLPPAALAAYLRRNIDYSLDEENQRGLRHFFTRAAALQLIPANRPIVWASVTLAPNPAALLGIGR